MRIVPLTPEAPPTRVVAVASGKGGAGKTSTAVNLGFALAAQGNKVCLLDADLGLSNVDIVLGVEPKHTLEDVLFNGVAMQDAIVPVGSGVDLVSGASGVPRLAELTRTDRRRLVTEVAAFDAYDFLLVDNSPGITTQVTSICLSARDILIVVNPDATSLTDAYALIKVLSMNGMWWNPLVLVNRAKNERQARLIFEKLRATAGARLKVNCVYLGAVLEDEAVAMSAALRKPLVLAAPGARASRDITAAAKALEARDAGSKGRDISAMRFLDGSIMRIKQDIGCMQGIAKGSARFKAKRTSANTADMFDRLDQGVRHLADDIPLDKRRRIAASLQKELKGLRDMLCSGGGEAAKDVSASCLAAAVSPKLKKSEGCNKPKGALLICPPSPMRDVLQEVLGASGLTAHAVHPAQCEGLDFCSYVLGLVCWDASAGDLEKLVAQAGDTPVLVLRGYRKQPRQEPCFEGRPVTVLHKPFRVGELSQAIQKTVRHH